MNYSSSNIILENKEREVVVRSSKNFFSFIQWSKMETYRIDNLFWILLETRSLARLPLAASLVRHCRRGEHVPCLNPKIKGWLQRNWKEKWLRGWKRWIANPLYKICYIKGSNPFFSVGWSSLSEVSKGALKLDWPRQRRRPRPPIESNNLIKRNLQKSGFALLRYFYNIQIQVFYRLKSKN